MSDEELFTIDAPRLAPPADHGGAGEPEHLVQFYDDVTFLAETAARFIGDALETGAAAVAIATPPHLDALAEHLRTRGLNVDVLRQDGRYVPLDAAAMLATFLRDGRLDAEQFADVVGHAIASAAGGLRRHVRIFGEMAMLLCEAGQWEPAIGLEGLWSDLARRLPFSLLCAYPIQSFATLEHGTRLRDVCTRHTHVIPAEGYAALATAEERLREIAGLQQKAKTLEVEMAERQALERALRRREREVTDFLENGMLALHRVGPEGAILWANKAELDLLGYAPEEYIGHHIAEFHVDRHVIDDLLARLLRGESLHNCAARLRCRDGSIKEVLISSNALWEEGEFIHTRCFTRDVTELRRVERERSELLARERSERAQAEAANRGKDEFLAALSHELRTPLTSVLGWTRILRSHALQGAELERALESIERNAKVQAQLIDDMLDVSRIIMGKLRLDVAEIDLGAVIQNALEVVKPGADAKGIAIRMVVDPGARTIVGDAARLQQVMWNLLSNSVKFTPEGGRIELRLARTGETVELAVSDTGKGIEPDFLPYVFERFRQGESLANRTSGGLGLGLAIVRHLVELHGGTVAVDSPGPGHGATFIVRLPGSPPPEAAT